MVRLGGRDSPQANFAANWWLFTHLHENRDLRFSKARSSDWFSGSRSFQQKNSESSGRIAGYQRCGIAKLTGCVLPPTASFLRLPIGRQRIANGHSASPTYQ
jgi:hypothetical protein